MLSLTGGDWVSGTGVFTKTGAITGVSVGMFAAVRVDAATVAALVGRVTAVDANTVTISTTAKSGSLANQTATCSLEVGGVWKGPNGADNFPFGFVAAAMMNASSHVVRVNFKNNATYSITAAISHSITGPVVWQGYTTTAGDGGLAIIDGGTSGSAYVLLTIGARIHLIESFEIRNNGGSGEATGLLLNSAVVTARRVVVHDVRGTGIVTSGGTVTDECEAYACNQSNTADRAGFRGSSTFIRCVSHDNTGSNTAGFLETANSNVAWIGCIADSNGADGFRDGGNGHGVLIGCDSYNNGGSGYRVTGTGSPIIHLCNSNFVKNGSYGVRNEGTATIIMMENCAFGSGTQANTSGTTSAGSGSAIQEVGTVTYAADVTPWVDPANGDFRINLAAAKGAGRGSFTQTASSYSGTIGYPDIGAAQTQSRNARALRSLIIGRAL